MSKRYRQKMHRIVLAAAVCLLLTGCSMDVESFLQPPMAQGEQQAVQTALETYISDGGKTGARYTLQYPSEGEYTSAFVLCNTAGTPVSDSGERPSLAIAFYSLPSAPENIHVNLLRRSGKEWLSIGDIADFGAEILQVAFGDLDGDGVKELLAGWSTYNSREHRLTVLSIANGLEVIDDDRLYSRLFAGPLIADEHDRLLLLRIGSAGEVTATVSEIREKALITVASTRIDGHIQQFGGMTLCRLDDRLCGLYVDASTGGGQTVTELLYYDGQALHAPFYDSETNTTAATARLSGLAARDADGDGQVDIPISTPLPGYAAAADTPSYGWLTVWRSWSLSAGDWSDRLYTIVNQPDGYMVVLSDARRSAVTTIYDAAARILSFTDQTTGVNWLRLQTGKQAAAGYTVLYEAAGDKPGCAVWFDPTKLDITQVRYMVSRLGTDGQT